MAKAKTPKEKGFKELRIYQLDSTWKDAAGTIVPSMRGNGTHTNNEKSCAIIHVTDGEGYNHGHWKRGFFGQKALSGYSRYWGTKGVNVGISLRGTMHFTFEEWDDLVDQVRQAKEEILGQEKLF